MSYIHKSGECKFKDCDKPSIMEGYCSFHYQLINQRRNIDVMSRMVELLCSMNDRLGHIENNLNPTSSHIVGNNSCEDRQDTGITNKKPNTSRPSSIFIPSINTELSSNVELKNLKTDETKRNILEIANKLHNISGE